MMHVFGGPVAWAGRAAWGGPAGWGGSFGVGGIFALISMILFWGLIIVGIVFLVRALSGSTRFAPLHAHDSRALEILKERYVKGEIDTAEYEEKRRTLTGTERTERTERTEQT